MTFCVQVYDNHEIVCEGSLTLVAAQREDMQLRMAKKLNKLLPAIALSTSLDSEAFS